MDLTNPDIPRHMSDVLQEYVSISDRIINNMKNKMI